MFYIKSTLTGQVYKVDTMPMFGDYVLSDEAEFNAYYRSKGIDPATV